MITKFGIFASIGLFIAVASSPAMAIGDCIGNQNCNTTNNNQTYNEGGTGIGVGLGGNAKAYGGDASARIGDVKAYGGNSDQRQGQIQGQAQGQEQSNRNYNQDYNSNKNTNLNGAAAKGNTTSTNLTVEGDNVEAPNIAPNVTLTSNGCTGSASGSIAPLNLFSFGAGGTFQYEDCLKNEFAKTLIAMGKRDEAFKLLASVDFVKAAGIETVGTPKRITPAGYQQAAYQTSSVSETVAWRGERLPDTAFVAGATVIAGMPE